MPSFGCQHSNMGLTLIDHCSESSCLRKGNFCREIFQRFEMCLTCFFTVWLGVKLTQMSTSVEG